MKRMHKYIFISIITLASIQLLCARATVPIAPVKICFNAPVVYFDEAPVKEKVLSSALAGMQQFRFSKKTTLDSKLFIEGSIYYCQRNAEGNSFNAFYKYKTVDIANLLKASDYPSIVKLLGSSANIESVLIGDIILHKWYFYDPLSKVANQIGIGFDYNENKKKCFIIFTTSGK
jgi:hypothetical protein